MDWQRLLSLFLWISPHAVLAAVAVLLFRRRLYKDFPAFTAYTLYETAAFVLLFVLNLHPRVTGDQYQYFFLATNVGSLAFRFGVIEEIFENVFRDYWFLKNIPRRRVLWVKAMVAVAAILFAFVVPSDNPARLMISLAAVDRGVSLVQSGLLVFLLCFSRIIGLSLRNYSFGIALGLGIYSTLDLGVSALRTETTTEHGIFLLNVLTVSSYLVCVLVWMGYLLAPDRKAAHLANLPNSELEEWNRELQHLLRP